MKTIVSGWIEDLVPIELPVFVGTCIVNDFKVETRFIPGDFLIGMEFMAMVSSRLVLDFENDHLAFQKG